MCFNSCMLSRYLVNLPNNNCVVYVRRTRGTSPVAFLQNHSWKNISHSISLSVLRFSVTMSALLKSQFRGVKIAGFLVRSTLFHFSARSKAPTVALDRNYDEEQALLETAKPFEEIPSLRTFPIVGSSWMYLPLIGKYNKKENHMADMDKYETYGSICREKYKSKYVVHIFDPEDVEKMFRHEGRYPERGNQLDIIKAYHKYRMDSFIPFELTNLKGVEWKDRRSKIQGPLMHPKAFEPYIESLSTISKDFINMIYFLRDENKEIPDFVWELYKWGLESVFLTVLDTRLGCLNRNKPENPDGLKFIESFWTFDDAIFKMLWSRGSMELWKWFPTPSWRKLVNAMDFTITFSLKLINEALNKMNEDEDKLTILKSMLNVPDLDERIALATISGVLQGGMILSSNVVTFLLYRLARNPNVQEKLYEEIARVLPSRSERLNTTSINELRYLKACIKESMRMNLPSSGNGRVLDHDIVLSGYRIPAGVQIRAALQATNRMEKYFKEANTFIPERWLNKENKPHPFLVLPFGFGPRTCIGKRFAEMQMMVVVSEIIRNCKVEYHYEDIGMTTKLTNCPDRPVKLRFIERQY